MKSREELIGPTPPATSLAPASFEPAYEAFYHHVLDVLDEHGVRYLLGGALSVNAYTGIWRWTKDLDLFLLPDDVGRARRACEGAGFRWVPMFDSWLAKTMEGDVFVDFIWRSANGLYAVDESWFERAQTMRVLGRDLAVIAPEDVILCKVFVAARNRFDGADVLHVIFRAHDRVDWERLAERGEQHADLLLAYAHLYRWAYPAFRDAIPDSFVDRLERISERQRDALAPPFRGNLLDFVSFRVDVEGFGLPDPHELLPQG